MNVRVYACDVGGKGNFGWARIPDSTGAKTPEGDSSIDHCIEAVNADIDQGLSVSLGMESPLFLPVPDLASDLCTGKNGDGDRSCFAPTGGFVAAIGVHQHAYLLRKLRLTRSGWTFDHAAWVRAAHPRPVLLWEAFVSKAAHRASAVRDAGTAVWEFWNRLEASALATDVTVDPPRKVLSLAGAAVLWVGWTRDPTVLHESLLVVKPSEPYTGGIAPHQGEATHGAPACRESRPGHDPKMGLYAAFLYGTNIPHGKRVTQTGIESALRPLQPSVTFAGIVGRPDSILLRCDRLMTEDSVRRAVSETLDCPCVVISAGTLERLVAAALDSVRVLRYPANPPYRVTSDGAEWELCLVLCSESLPPNADGPTWLFSPTRTAVALKVLERRALLVRKRRHTERGGRIMLGATLIDPWERRLDEKGVTIACLTSRTLNRVAKVVGAAKTLEASTSR